MGRGFFFVGNQIEFYFVSILRYFSLEIKIEKKKKKTNYTFTYLDNKY